MPDPGACWWQPLFEGTLDPGTSRSWAGHQPVTLALGNPAAVTLTINGHRHSPLGPGLVTLTFHPATASR